MSEPKRPPLSPEWRAWMLNSQKRIDAAEKRAQQDKARYEQMMQERRDE